MPGRTFAYFVVYVDIQHERGSDLGIVMTYTGGAFQVYTTMAMGDEVDNSNVLSSAATFMIVCIR